MPTEKGSIGVFRVGEQYVALINKCPHSGAPLCAGTVTGRAEVDADFNVSWGREGEILKCPWHQWEFDLLTGKSLTGPNFRAKRFDVAVEDDEVVLYT